jgi:hypothetical protein
MFFLTKSAKRELGNEFIRCTGEGFDLLTIT